MGKFDFHLDYLNDIGGHIESLNYLWLASKCLQFQENPRYPKVKMCCDHWIPAKLASSLFFIKNHSWHYDFPIVNCGDKCDPVCFCNFLRPFLKTNRCYKDSLMCSYIIESLGKGQNILNSDGPFIKFHSTKMSNSSLASFASIETSIS